MRTQRRPVYTRDVLTALKRGYSVVTRVASQVLKFSGSLKATLSCCSRARARYHAGSSYTILTLLPSRISSCFIIRFRSLFHGFRIIVLRFLSRLVPRAIVYTNNKKKCKTGRIRKCFTPAVIISIAIVSTHLPYIIPN